MLLKCRKKAENDLLAEIDEKCKQMTYKNGSFPFVIA